MTALKSLCRRLVDIGLVPLLAVAAAPMALTRRFGMHRLPLSRNLLLRLGVVPVVDHYYEPFFEKRIQSDEKTVNRQLPGVDFAPSNQRQLLSQFSYASEISDVEFGDPETNRFRIDNGSFEAGDAEIWYQVIRYYKPSRICEIGSGQSTLLAQKAIARNKRDDPNYTCRHLCVEPYENPWLAETGVELVRAEVETLDPGFFADLGANDILFIDSSHIIRPDGDVLFEYLEILPRLKRGVIVQIHDIFSPSDYPERWKRDEIKFWNEQYLLEAFLSENSHWEVLLALNYLNTHYHGELKAAAPYVTPNKQPGSFYIRKSAA